MRLAKRVRRFALVDENGSRRNPLLKGFHAKQRETVVLTWNEKPQPGFKQLMPPRKAKS